MAGIEMGGHPVRADPSLVGLSAHARGNDMPGAIPVCVALLGATLVIVKGEESRMEKRLVTVTPPSPPEAADENQRRVEAVFTELEASKPDNVSCIVLRLAHGSFVHVSFHNHTDDEVNPIASTKAFSRFQEGHEERRQGSVDQQTASLVGAYVTVIG